ncbi:MAG TPA: ATP-grasp domain-containing protein [Vicinamibacterales bacterium]|nr:ATP-grasp domain-containing protein [Vicinamibacterales bacterium]
MTRVLLLATTTGYQIRSFGEAAKRLGVELVFASDRCDQLDDPWADHAIPVHFWDEAYSLEAILAACRTDSIHGIIAVGDHPTILAAHVAHALGLPGNPPEAVRASRNKLASRRAFQNAGLLTPTFFEASMTDDPSALAPALTYPVVLKPLALAGSRGVMRADQASDFVWAFERLAGLLKSPDVLNERDEVHGRALVESYIPGNEFAIEGVMTDAVFRPFMIFDKPDPLVGPFFEETIYVTPSRASDVVQKAIVDQVAAAARALGLRHGPIHAECRVNTKGVYLLEVAARPIGGLCARAVRFDGPQELRVPLEEVLIRHSLGENIEPWRPSSDASGVMMIPIPRRGVYRGAQGVNEAAALHGIDDIRITAKPDQLLLPLPEGRSYLGFIFASGKEPADVEQALRDAHGMLAFDIAREIELVRP